jgi:hypothetical protein
MDRLTEVLKQTMSGYTGEALNGYSYLTSSDDQQIFTVVSVGQVRDKRIVETGLIARVIGGQIVIERDVNDKPLVDALMQNGLPRNLIVLTYAGEAVPEPL